MKLLFKPLPSVSVVTQMSQTDFKEHYPSVEGGLDWKNLQPYIRQATTMYIVPFLGEDFYDKLSVDFHSDTIDPIANEIVATLQDAIAYYTIYKAMPFIPFVVSSAGIQKQQSAQGAIAMSIGERANTRWNAHLDADKFLDKTIAQLSLCTSAYIDLWRTHAAKFFKRSAFFRDAVELTDYLNIQDSRRAFQALVPHLRAAEEELEKVLGADLLAALLLENLAVLEKNLRLITQKYIAQKALYESIPFLTLVIESDGFMVVSRGDGLEERNGLKHQQHENALLRLREAAKEKAEKYRTDLIGFLWKNKDVLVLWQFSDLYKNLSSEKAIHSGIIRNGNGGFFIN